MCVLSTVINLSYRNFNINTRKNPCVDIKVYHNTGYFTQIKPDLRHNNLGFKTLWQEYNFCALAVDRSTTC